jgi:hypothetical protein
MPDQSTTATTIPQQQDTGDLQLESIHNASLDDARNVVSTE